MQFGRIKSLKELPLEEGAEGLREEGHGAQRGRREAQADAAAQGPAPELAEPRLTEALTLKKNAKARPPGTASPQPSARVHRVDHGGQARRRRARGASSRRVEWLAEGKQRNWKYMK